MRLSRTGSSLTGVDHAAVATMFASELYRRLKRQERRRLMDLKQEGVLQQYRGKIRSLWGKVTDDDIDQARGNLDSMIGIIKQKTGEAEEMIRARLHEMSKHDDDPQRDRAAKAERENNPEKARTV
jgi:uncharacterized protein YjbJ (UPF0337 family)